MASSSKRHRLQSMTPKTRYALVLKLMLTKTYYACHPCSGLRTCWYHVAPLAPAAPEELSVIQISHIHISIRPASAACWTAFVTARQRTMVTFHIHDPSIVMQDKGHAQTIRPTSPFPNGIVHSSWTRSHFCCWAADHSGWEAGADKAERTALLLCPEQAQGVHLLHDSRGEGGWQRTPPPPQPL